MRNYNMSCYTLFADLNHRQTVCSFFLPFVLFCFVLFLVYQEKESCDNVTVASVAVLQII